jgi:hypothetical protein
MNEGRYVERERTVIAWRAKPIEVIKDDLILFKDKASAEKTINEIKDKRYVYEPIAIRAKLKR